MNELYLSLLCFLISFFITYAIITYTTYRGTHVSLANSDVGSVYNFRYLQPLTGTYERYLAKVISVRRFTELELYRLNFHSDYRVHDERFHRSNTLVTCKLPNGDIRNFYAERVIDCNRSIFGKLLYTTIL